MRTVKVPLGDRSYSISIDEGAISSLGAECKRLRLSRRCAVITDRRVAPLYESQAVQSLVVAGFEPVIVRVPAGEPAKSLRHVELCYRRLAAHRIERGSFVVALGGGVVGDLAGFVAATYLRGIALVQVPTTLLAQVDSSVGGKVGVNLPQGKNLVGPFPQPHRVLCDLKTLSTLPDRELRAGLAEVIKYGIIRDAALFRRLERDLIALLARDTKVLGPVIRQCCAIKADVVGADEKEGGVRAILNFGHTIGHAIEAISGYGRYLHGEAISIGQIAAAHISADRLGLPTADVDRIERLFTRAGLPTRIRLGRGDFRRLVTAMKVDKKVRAGEIRFVLARSIGVVEYGLPVPEADIQKALNRG